jgi:cyclohexa-1,5-dienecarbonyl-CoA hydratase
MTIERVESGAVWIVRLNTPKANILDSAKIDALTRVYRDARDNADLKAIIITGEGPHFSFGASVEEHLADRCAAMLSSFHALFGTMLDASVLTIAAVRGQCLGGGMELAAFCQRVIASEDARFGQPEILLGVFAPAASVVLTERMGRGGAEDLLLTGRSMPANDALRLGLVDEIQPDPLEAALAYARTHLLALSASSLRRAVRAARLGFAERFRREIAEIEALYLRDLMHTDDAGEGLNAFLEKRKPEWRNR